MFSQQVAFVIIIMQMKTTIILCALFHCSLSAVINTCKTYPLYIGGYYGDSYFTDLALSPSKNELLVQGYTYDVTLELIDYETPMTLVFYENINTSPISIRWAKTSTTWSGSFRDIGFSPDGEKIVGGITYSSYTSYILTLSSSKGEVLSSYYFSYRGSLSGLIMASDSTVYAQFYYYYSYDVMVYNNPCCPPIYQTYTYFYGMYFGFKAIPSSSSLQWGRYWSSSFTISTGTKLLDSGKLLVVLLQSYTSLLMQLINTETSSATVTDTFAKSISSLRSLVISTKVNQIILGLSDPATKIQIDEINRKFSTFEGWSLNSFPLSSPIDIFFEQTDTNSISVLYNNNNVVCLGRLYIDNSTFVQWNQISGIVMISGAFLSKDTYLFGYTWPYQSQQPKWISKYYQEAIMSNIPGQSCYPIQTTSYNLYTLAAITEFQQGSDPTTTFTLSLTRYQLSFQDMRLQQLTSIQSWCPNKGQSFTFDSSFTNTFYVNYGNSTVSLGDLLYCGSPPMPVVTDYSLKNTNATPGLALNGMSFDITTELKGGVYKGTVVASTGSLIAELNYTLVLNMPPNFTQTLKPFKLQMGLVSSYTLPSIIDKESDPYTFNLELISVNTTNTSQPCITLAEAQADTSVLMFDNALKKMKVDVSNPALPDTWRCDYFYKITLKDSKGAINEQSMKISIILENLAPEWVYDPPEPIFMHVGEILPIALPKAEDPNGDVVTLIDISRPQFSSPPNFSLFQYTLTPTLQAHIGLFYITGNLSDGQAITKYLPFSIEIRVFNFAPYFVENLINQTQIVDEFVEYKIPEAKDYENHQFSLTVCFGANKQQCNTTMPGFIEYLKDLRTFQFTGGRQDKGNYTIQIRLTDKLGNSSISFFTLKIMDYQASQAIEALTASLQNKGPPNFVTLIPTTLAIEEGKTQQIKLPQIQDPDNDPYECTVNLGSAMPFITYKDLSLILSPLQAYKKPFQVNIQLKDKNQYSPKSKKYRLDITVTPRQANSSSSGYYIQEGKNTSEDQNSKNSHLEKSVVRLKLVEVTQGGRARIKVYAKFTEKIMELISNQTFTIKMDDGEVIEEVPFYIESSSSNKFVLRLIFNNPERVSSSQNFDQLIITTRREIHITTPQYYETLPVGITLSTFIPPQLSESAVSQLVLIKKTGDYASYALVSSNLLLNIFLQAILYFELIQFRDSCLSFRIVK
ncbi:hypothetical protein FGO68_gene15222 [Halteria grandinella]|uniref:Cadherin-like protein n=1 Tax=Halteria grandinella TaxID=5974 RepID=A0A8J8P4S2_HALGN|nr:hypothetical protein FGO68_gene15222 [Halteria grandinella]